MSCHCPPMEPFPAMFHRTWSSSSTAIDPSTRPNRRGFCSGRKRLGNCPTVIGSESTLWPMVPCIGSPGPTGTSPSSRAAAKVRRPTRGSSHRQKSRHRGVTRIRRGVRHTISPTSFPGCSWRTGSFSEFHWRRNPPLPERREGSIHRGLAIGVASADGQHVDGVGGY